MKHFIILVFCWFCALTSLTAQENSLYNNAIGLRGGVSQGITYKHFFNKPLAMDAIFSVYEKGLTVQFLGEYHAYDMVSGENFLFFAGGGFHLGYYDPTKNHEWNPEANDDYYAVIGLDPVIGAEYVFDEIPLNVSLDIKPAFNIINNNDFWLSGAISVRYIFDDLLDSRPSL